MNADRAFLVSGATLDDEPIGPLHATAMEAHRLARTAIAKVGGTAYILRDSPAGLLEVARYTDSGPGPSLEELVASGRVVFLDSK